MLSGFQLSRNPSGTLTEVTRWGPLHVGGLLRANRVVYLPFGPESRRKGTAAGYVVYHQEDGRPIPSVGSRNGMWLSGYEPGGARAIHSNPQSSQPPESETSLASRRASAGAPASFTPYRVVDARCNMTLSSSDRSHAASRYIPTRGGPVRSMAPLRGCAGGAGSGSSADPDFRCIFVRTYFV